MDNRAMLTHQVKLYDLLASSVPTIQPLEKAAPLEDVVDSEWEDGELKKLDLRNLSMLGTEEGLPVKRADGAVYVTPWVYLRACLLAELAKGTLTALGISVDDTIQISVIDPDGSSRQIKAKLDEVLGATLKALPYIPLMAHLAEKL